uniref:Uncharacterized protein n=1 Tax=Panagrolaimus sp. PS1159 TaxID=55785 RepID=A0AC35FZ90_9BILA
MTSSTPKSLLIAIGNYACEKHFPETVEALIKDCFFDVEEKSRLLFELKVHALNFKAENAEKVIKLMERIKIIFAQYFVGDANTLTYFSKVLGVFSILKSGEPSNIDLMTLLCFRNTVDCYFPERMVSANDDNVRMYEVMRKIFLKISINVTILKQFCENELEKRWKKFEENFCESALSLVERGFKYIEECNNSEVEGIKIHEHPWWIDFQLHYSTQQENDCDETYKTFVEFVKDKISKEKRKIQCTKKPLRRP